MAGDNNTKDTIPVEEHKNDILTTSEQEKIAKGNNSKPRKKMRIGIIAGIFLFILAMLFSGSYYVWQLLVEYHNQQEQ